LEQSGLRTVFFFQRLFNIEDRPWGMEIWIKLSGGWVKTKKMDRGMDRKG
jgi:hypothetical protein